MGKVPGPQDITRAKDYKTHLVAWDWNVIKSEITRLVEAARKEAHMAYTQLPVPVQLLNVTGKAPGYSATLSLSALVPPTTKAVHIFIRVRTLATEVGEFRIGPSYWITHLPAFILYTYTGYIYITGAPTIPIDQDYSFIASMILGPSETGELRKSVV